MTPQQARTLLATYGESGLLALGMTPAQVEETKRLAAQ
jgi:hypothetical protein